MIIPEGAEQPMIETTFIMEKDGERKEFTLEEYPDSTWTFVDTKTKIIKKGYEPPIHDFSIVRLLDDRDITELVLRHKGYTLLLISPHLENADDGCFGKIDEIYEYSLEKNIPFYCLTASIGEGIEHWIEITGAEYPFCNTDETTLKTIIRSNPGLVMLKDGVVVGKWSHNDLPDKEELKEI
jgi:triosephosphate isomerase